MVDIIPLIVQQISESLVVEDIAVKDFLLGFFFALTLRRGRVKLLFDKVLPTGDESSRASDDGSDSSGRDPSP